MWCSCRTSRSERRWISRSRFSSRACCAFRRSGSSSALTGALLVALLCSPAAAQEQRTAPTFNDDVAPILHRRCAACHRPGRSAPFPLLTYDDAARRATLIAEVTARRSMPPWQPEPQHADFADARRLDDREIDTIRRWVEGGRREGDPARRPALPSFASGWQLGPPDLVLTVPPGYTLARDGADVFRTFVIAVPVAARQHVRALEFDPGDTTAIHHANIKVDASRSSRWLDEQDAVPGYDGAGARGAAFPDGHFLGWTPGQSPRTTEEAPWPLAPDSDLVVELHMTPTGREEAIQPRMALYFTTRKPAYVPFMIRLGRQDIDIAAGDAHYVSSDSYRLPAGLSLLALQPHAHFLATEMRAFATLPDGAVRPLLHIRKWDPRWQDVYRFRDAVRLPQGTRVTMQYVYDNSARNRRNPHSPPQRVTFGQTSASEMGDLWLQVVASSEADRRLLEADARPKMLRDDIAGAEKVLARSPDDPRAHADLAFCYLAAGRTAEGLAALRRVVELDPASPGARYDLGMQLLRDRRFAEAGEQFRAAIQIKTDFPEAFNSLGIISHAQGELEPALTWYLRAVASNPRDAHARYNAGRVLATLGRLDDAATQFERALAVEPDDAEMHAGFASVLARRQETPRAVAHYRRALELSPDLPAALVDLAWILATSEAAALRQPAEAVRLAERLVHVTKERSPTALDTLAVAYAAADRLDEAVATAARALAAARAAGAAPLADMIERRLKEYERRRSRP